MEKGKSSRRQAREEESAGRNARVEERVARKRGRTIRVGGKSEANGAGV